MGLLLLRSQLFDFLLNLNLFDLLHGRNVCSFLGSSLGLLFSILSRFLSIDYNRGFDFLLFSGNIKVGVFFSENAFELSVFILLLLLL